MLPCLLFEGSSIGRGLEGGEEEAEAEDVVRVRGKVVREVDETLEALLENFYEQLSAVTAVAPVGAADATGESGAMLGVPGMAGVGNVSGVSVGGGGKGGGNGTMGGAKEEGVGEMRRYMERLLLKMDFTGQFSNPKNRVDANGEGILKEGGIV